MVLAMEAREGDPAVEKAKFGRLTGGTKSQTVCFGLRASLFKIEFSLVAGEEFRELKIGQE